MIVLKNNLNMYKKYFKLTTIRQKKQKKTDSLYFTKEVGEGGTLLPVVYRYVEVMLTITDRRSTISSVASIKPKDDLHKGQPMIASVVTIKPTVVLHEARSTIASVVLINLMEGLHKA